MQAAEAESGQSLPKPRGGIDRLKFGEVEIADRLQCFGERAVLQVLRQAIQPGGILNLGFHEAGDVVGPASGPAAMIERGGACG